MPVRSSATAPAPKEPTPSLFDAMETKESAELRTHLYTLDELMNAKTASLETALTEMGIDYSDYKGRNTHKKLRELVLANQGDHLENAGTVPALEFENTDDLKKLTVPETTPTVKALEVATVVIGPLVSSVAAPAVLVEARSPGNVRYTAGATVNTGNYESHKYDVSISLPLNPTADDIAAAEATLTICEEIVARRLAAKIQESRALGK